MKYESEKTLRGNIGLSYESQAAADAQAAAMDAGENRNCYGCSRCSYCSDCSDCLRCSDCSDCSGVLSWAGPRSSALLALNGLCWPVAVSGTHMQIGCQNHSHTDWAKFSDRRIALMHPDAAAFWAAHKARLLALCELRAGLA